MLETIIALAERFRAQQHELYMVGGCVRDLLMQREGSPDIDLTTDARPDEIKRLTAATGPIDVVTVGERFGTVALHYRRAVEAEAPTGAPVQGPRREPEFSSLMGNHPVGVEVVEITTYRSDFYHPDSRKPEVSFGDTLEGDLMRRDFTINAMARDPLTGEIIDPWGGRADLERKIIRAVGDDPHQRFDDDPLRMLRAIRFAAQFGFEIEQGTAEAIQRQAATLAKISNERIRDELNKALTSPRPDMALRLLVSLGLAPYTLPEVLELRGVSQAPAHSKDVFEHVLRVVAGTAPRPGLRWAALLHDIAKPRTYSVENGKVHFYGHEDLGAVMARDILRRLRFDRPFIEFVSRIVKMHMRANAYLPDWTDGAVRRLMFEAGEALPDLLDLSRADITSYRPEKVARAVARVNEMEARCDWLRQEAERVPIKSPLDGNDLMELFQREPGPWLRVVKDRLLGLVIDGELAPDDRERAALIARETLAEFEASAPVERAPRRRGRSAMPPPASGAGDEASLLSATSEGSEQTPSAKREARAASRRKSRGAVAPQERRPPRPGATTLTRAAPRRSSGAHLAPQRDALVSFLDDYLAINTFRDLAPNGMQVIGKAEVRRVALAVSANLEVIEQAAQGGADMLICHHGLFIERDPHPILARQKRRLKALFDADITLLGYHLPLDAHPEVGNNALWLRRLGFTIESLDFSMYQGRAIGAIGVREEPLPFTALVERVAEVAGATPRVYPYGPEQVRRLAVVTGAAPGSLAEAVERGCDAYLTGETAEGTQAFAREERANFIGAGHYNTERLGVQALGDLLRERFGVETFFIEVANDV